jgi:fumarate hydratase subunit beta
MSLRAGNEVLLSGVVYTARDAAHKRMYDLIAAGGRDGLPFEFEGAAVYYAGPSPTPPGRIIGAIGPTTSGRMDAYSPLLIKNGLRVMIGKGIRGREVMEAIAEYKGIYFAALGGAAALMARAVKSAELIAFEDLGAEAVRRLCVEDMPLVVAADCYGGCVYGP